MSKTETGAEVSLKRLQKLQAVLRDHKLDGALLFHSRDIFYYTGTAQPGWLAIRGDGQPARLRGAGVIKYIA